MTKEAQIESDLLGKLADLKYTSRPDIRNREALERNFREKFQALNRCTLSDSEFARLRDEIITSDVFAASKRLREMNTFTREDGTPLQYTLVNIKDWCKNEFEVVNQLRMNTENSHHRYDIILLLNGLPLVQIELKTFEIKPQKAMQQIVDYKKDPGNGFTNSLMCFVQLFIVSNERSTSYFTNNNNNHFQFDANEQYLPVYKHANPDNSKVDHLHEFAKKFLAKCTLAEMLSRYMVLVATEQKLLIMRPYQIYAVKAIVDCIRENRGNGYIWHTTGSGKTLTSFKASTLLKDNPDIHKCLFVVDRKDLDRQTREEFNKFQKDCVEENTNTHTLVSRLLSDSYADKVIVTTIQKLGLALDENSKRNKEKTKDGKPTYKELLEPLRDKRIAIIFDECHRSQFGDNHAAIKAFFPKAQLFGFTGTPIFKENATAVQREGEKASKMLTEDIFQKSLHEYTIADAINDGNVLKFHIDFFKPDAQEKLGAGEFLSPKSLVQAILAKHDATTNQRQYNAILASSSINHAIDIYQTFKKIQAERRENDPDFRPLNIACVFSPPAEGDKDIKQLQEDLENERRDNEEKPEEKKKALAEIIADYNQQYGTNHRIQEFDNYYQDVQKRIKDQKYSNKDFPHRQKIDITIVVDMLLTGFDSKYLNTLYVDKNLKHHGLIQAFSRTNRTLTGNKMQGNILDFRQQQAEVDFAIKLFSNTKKEDDPKKIWLVEPAPVVAKKFTEAVAELADFMQSHGLENKPEQVINLKGDIAQRTFLEKFKEVRRLKNQLDQYTELDEALKTDIETALPSDDLRAFCSKYNEVARKYKEVYPEPARQFEFEYVLFASALIDYDYIIALAAKAMGKPDRDNKTREQIIELIAAYSNLEADHEDIADFLRSLDWSMGRTEQQIKDGFQTFRREKNARELAQIAQNHGLETAALHSFVDSILARSIFDSEKLTDLLEPLELGWKARAKKETELMAELAPFLTKIAGRDIAGLKVYEDGK